MQRQSAYARLAHTGACRAQHRSCLPLMKEGRGQGTRGAELDVLGDPGPGLQTRRLVQTV